MLVLLLLLIAAYFPAASYAQEPPTGNDLLPECAALMELNKQLDEGEESSALQNLQAMSCLSYVGGVVDSNILHGLVEGTSLFCPPVGADLMQAAAIVTKYLEENPEKLHQGRIVLVHAALIQAFPCKTEQR